jgi:hypothetical protein
MKDAACPIPRSTDELRRDRKVAAELTDCVWEVILQTWVSSKVPEGYNEVTSSEVVCFPYDLLQNLLYLGSIRRLVWYALEPRKQNF